MIEYTLSGLSTEQNNPESGNAPANAPCRCKTREGAKAPQVPGNTYVLQLDSVVWALFLVWLMIFLVRKMFE